MPAHTITEQQAEDWADSLALEIMSLVSSYQFDVARRRLALQLRMVKAEGEMAACTRITAALDAVRPTTKPEKP
jgi:hypothetical protein